MTDVFVSYKAEDRRRIRLLVDSLQADGCSVWWDAHLGGGEEWRESIVKHLDAASAVIVIWSRRSVGPSGDFVRDEASRAKRRGAYIPVRIDKVDPPLGFGETQCHDLRGWNGNRSDVRYQALVSAISARQGGEEALSVPSSAATLDRRTLFASATGIVALSAAGGGAWLLMHGSRLADESIAVLPFANLSGDPAQAYFSDGVAEEIRTALCRVGGLKVAGRISSEAVRTDDAETAARKLSVANILTGSVRQSSSTIRITAELIDGRSGMDRWSQAYDRSPGDAIKIQSDIAEKVAAALSAALGRAAAAVVGIGGTQNVEAQRLFIEAGALTSGAILQPRYTKALELLDAALALDSRYAAAFARKSCTLTQFANNFANANELARDRAEAFRLARTAFSLAPNLAYAHQALGAAYSSALQIAPALRAYKRAIELAPADAEILALYTYFISLIGAPDQAITLANEAIKLDPLNAEPYHTRIEALFYAHRFDDAVTAGEALQRRLPSLFKSAMVIADSLVMLGRFQDAERYYAFENATFWQRLTGEAIMAIRSRDPKRALEKVEELRQVYGDAASTQYAQIYAQLGDKDRAFAALGRAYAIRDGGLQALRTDPFLAPLKTDPRFAELVRKLDFPL